MDPGSRPDRTVRTALRRCAIRFTMPKDDPTTVILAPSSASGASTPERFVQLLSEAAPPAFDAENSEPRKYDPFLAKRIDRQRLVQFLPPSVILGGIADRVDGPVSRDQILDQAAAGHGDYFEFLSCLGYRARTGCPQGPVVDFHRTVYQVCDREYLMDFSPNEGQLLLRSLSRITLSDHPGAQRHGRAD